MSINVNIDALWNGAKEIIFQNLKYRAYNYLKYKKLIIIVIVG